MLWGVTVLAVIKQDQGAPRCLCLLSGEEVDVVSGKLIYWLQGLSLGSQQRLDGNLNDHAWRVEEGWRVWYSLLISPHGVLP